MNMFERPAFVRKVLVRGEELGHPDIFERWLDQAAAGNLWAMINLRDYGLIPHTSDELKELLDERRLLANPSVMI